MTPDLSFDLWLDGKMTELSADSVVEVPPIVMWAEIELVTDVAVNLPFRLKQSVIKRRLQIKVDTGQIESVLE